MPAPFAMGFHDASANDVGLHPTNISLMTHAVGTVVCRTARMPDGDANTAVQGCEYAK